MKQVPLPLSPEPQAGFEAFVPGDNTLVLAHLQHTVPPRTPLYLWGPAGSGKTHLLKALAQACCAQGVTVAALTASAAAFEWPAGVGLVVLDDIDSFDAAAQARAFAALVQAQGLGVAWAAAGRVPPVDLPLREDLRTRLGWGHVFALEPLDEAGTRSVLQREAQRRGIRWRDEVLEYLMRRFQRDLGSLLRIFDRLDLYALSRSREITLPLLRDMLQEASGHNPEATGPDRPGVPR